MHMISISTQGKADCMRPSLLYLPEMINQQAKWELCIVFAKAACNMHAAQDAGMHTGPQMGPYRYTLMSDFAPA